MQEIRAHRTTREIKLRTISLAEARWASRAASRAGDDSGEEDAASVVAVDAVVVVVAAVDDTKRAMSAAPAAATARSPWPRAGATAVPPIPPWPGGGIAEAFRGGHGGSSRGNEERMSFAFSSFFLRKSAL